MGCPGPQGLNPGEPVRYVVELKVDGVAVSLRYEHGQASSWGRPAATASGATTSRPTSRPSARSRWRSTAIPLPCSRSAARST